MTRILIVDDDIGIRGLVSSFLEKHGFEVDTAGDVAQMYAKLEHETFSLIVLDVMMPGEDGLSALRQLQRRGTTPVIMLSAVATDVDRIVGLEIGAEDYLAKPCNPRELLARIRTVLRRVAATPSPGSPPNAFAALGPASAATPANAAPAPATPSENPDILHFAGWRIDLASRVVHDPANAEVALSDGEFRLLRAFCEHPRRVLHRDQLLDYARGADRESYDRAIDVQISRLRRKLSFGAQRNDLIRTVRNEGYMFVPAVTRG